MRRPASTNGRSADLRALIEHLHRTGFTAALSIAMWHSMRWSPTGLLREQATQTEGKGIIPLRNPGGLQQHLLDEHRYARSSERRDAAFELRSAPQKSF